MAKFLKLIGSGNSACPEPYDLPFVDFSGRSRPERQISVGDELILYAAGGRKSIFAKATVQGKPYNSGRKNWPTRVDIEYRVNLLPRNGVPIEKVNVNRDLVNSVGRQSYIRLSEAEFELADTLLHEAEKVLNEPRFFTTYWKNSTWKDTSRIIPVGELFEHTASNDFRKRGMTAGDAIYVVTVKEGARISIAGKMIVEQIVGQEDAENALGIKDLWKAKDHALGRYSTRIDWDLEVPRATAESREFFSPNGGTARLRMVGPDFIDRQTLRGVRRLTPTSAQALDLLLGPLVRIPTLWSGDADVGSLGELESYADGKQKSKFVTYYERDPKNREAAVRLHGYRCKGCDFSMEERYGPVGKEFIHVHHVKPVSQFEKAKEINPATDLTVLCPNCHAIVHRKRSRTLSVEELRNIIKLNPLV